MSDTSLTSSVKHSLVSLIVLANIQTFRFTLCVYFFFARIICKIYLLGMLCNKVVCMLLFWLVSLLLSKLNLFILCWLDCQKL